MRVKVSSRRKKGSRHSRGHIWWGRRKRGRSTLRSTVGGVYRPNRVLRPRLWWQIRTNLRGLPRHHRAKTVNNTRACCIFLVVLARSINYWASGFNNVHKPSPWVIISQMYSFWEWGRHAKKYRGTLLGTPLNLFGYCCINYTIITYHWFMFFLGPDVIDEFFLLPGYAAHFYEKWVHYTLFVLPSNEFYKWYVVSATSWPVVSFFFMWKYARYIEEMGVWDDSRPYYLERTVLEKWSEIEMESLVGQILFWSHHFFCLCFYNYYYLKVGMSKAWRWPRLINRRLDLSSRAGPWWNFNRLKLYNWYTSAYRWGWPIHPRWTLNYYSHPNYRRGLRISLFEPKEAPFKTELPDDTFMIFEPAWKQGAFILSNYTYPLESYKDQFEISIPPVRGYLWGMYYPKIPKHLTEDEYVLRALHSRDYAHNSFLFQSYYRLSAL